MLHFYKGFFPLLLLQNLLSATVLVCRGGSGDGGGFESNPVKGLGSCASAGPLAQKRSLETFSTAQCVASPNQWFVCSAELGGEA